jgi:hypothetical protein
MPPLFAARRSEVFFRELSDGNPIAWIFLVAGLGGFIWWSVDYYRKRARKGAAAPSAVTRSEARAPAPVTGEVPCPHCGGMIRAGASFCKHCREFLS